MFRAIGVAIILLTLSKMFSNAFVAFEEALVASFGFIESAANVASVELSASQTK